MTQTVRGAAAATRPLPLPLTGLGTPRAVGARLGELLVDIASRLHARLLRRAVFVALIAWAVVEALDVGAALWAHRFGSTLDAGIAMVVLVAALVSSVAGFAFSALAGSALAHLHVDPVRAVETMVVCSTASQLYAVWKVRAAIRWSAVAPMLAGGVLTVPVGVWLLHHVAAMVYALTLGILMTGYGCYAVARRSQRVFRGNLWLDGAAGALGGITGGLAGFPGAFVTIWCSLRGWDKLRQRATYQPYILAMQVVTLACLWSSASPAALWHATAFVPFALLGALAGFALFERMSDNQFGKAVGALLIVAGVGLLARLV